MARIAGVDLPREKRVEIGLTYIYGIGRPTATKILEETGINPDTRVKDLSEEQVSLIRDYIEKIFMSKATSREKSVSTSNDLWKSVATEAFVTEKVSPSAVRAPSRMPAPERVPSAPSVARRKANNGGVELWQVKRLRKERILSA